MPRNETTSKRVAKIASEVLDDTDELLAQLKKAQIVISRSIVMLEKAKSVAASSLTQSPDKKRKKQ